MRFLLACAPATQSWTAGSPAPLSQAEWETLATLWPLPPLPDDPTNAFADDPRAAALGETLFFDEGLGEKACASCHDPELGWTDGKTLPDDVTRHTPTVLNSGYQRWLFWDGRCDTLWCQALGPIEAANEMNGSRVAVAHHVANAFADEYEDIFGPLPDLGGFPTTGKPGDDGEWYSLTDGEQVQINTVFANVGKSLAAFERTIVSRDSAFDRWAEAVLTGADSDFRAIRGYQLFVGEARCVRCHFGPNFSSGEFHNVGLGGRDWIPPGDRGRAQGIAALQLNEFNGAGPYSDAPDAGYERIRYVTGGAEYEGQFKVPTLRNVADTAPYMHGGHFDTLDELLEFYVGDAKETPEFGHRDEVITATLDEDQRAELRAFLETL